MAAALRISGQSDRRLSDRTEFGRRGTLRRGDKSEPVEISVLDLTREGCLIKTERELSVGDQIEIGIANLGRMKACVMWRADDSFGCAFDQPLAPGAVTVALGPTNILGFPHETPVPTASPKSQKVSPRGRITLLVIASVVAWIAFSAVAIVVFRIAKALF